MAAGTAADRMVPGRSLVVADMGLAVRTASAVRRSSHLAGVPAGSPGMLVADTAGAATADRPANRQAGLRICCSSWRLVGYGRSCAKPVFQYKGLVGRRESAARVQYSMRSQLRRGYK